MEPSPSTHCRVYYPFTCVVLSHDNMGNTFGHATPKANIADGPLQPLLDRDNTIARENLNLICLTRRREAENILNRAAGRLNASDGTPRLRENIHQFYLPMQSGRTLCGSWESCGCFLLIWDASKPTRSIAENFLHVSAPKMRRF